jgi:hypothetical protein
LCFVQLVFNRCAYRDKKVVGVFVRFRAPLQKLSNALASNASSTWYRPDAIFR